jgi:hypothetical protein
MGGGAAARDTSASGHRIVGDGAEKPRTVGSGNDLAVLCDERAVGRPPWNRRGPHRVVGEYGAEPGRELHAPVSGELPPVADDIEPESTNLPLTLLLSRDDPGRVVPAVLQRSIAFRDHPMPRPQGSPRSATADQSAASASLVRDMTKPLLRMAKATHGLTAASCSVAACVGSPADTLEQAGSCHPLNAVGFHAGELGIARGEDPSAAGQPVRGSAMDLYGMPTRCRARGHPGALRIERVDTSDRCACNSVNSSAARGESADQPRAVPGGSVSP